MLNIDDSQVVANKVDNHSLVERGSELLLIVEYASAEIMKWQSIVQKEIQDAYDILMLTN